MGEETSDKTSELYKSLPFMESFPFEEYEITLEKEGIDAADLGIDPIIVNALGTFGTDQKVNFFYMEGEYKIQVTFFQDDIAFISEVSDRIKKLDSVHDDLDIAIYCGDIEVKLAQAKKSKKFGQILGSGSVFALPFEDILDDLLKLYEAHLTSEQRLGLQKLNLTKIMSKPLNIKEVNMIRAYLNFQLNYAKILLGIVIAAKIY